VEICVKDLDKTWYRVSFMPECYVNVFPILKFLRIIVFSACLTFSSFSVNTNYAVGKGVVIILSPEQLGSTEQAYCSINWSILVPRTL
jgi:hypothetical protein